ncbi:MAG TPA: efflux transporter outer membrane subunit [Candidatus Sulfotelmatobacter sp.]|nr:efflux transporter outer membrane subunit [Candidatus Sulfotelmatobacter sp.]
MRNLPIQPKFGRGLRALCMAALASTLGCVVGPKYHAPAPPAPAAANYKESTVNFQDSQGWKVASPQDAMLRGKWWEIFKDPELNALEEQVDVNNQNIKQYFENLMVARAEIREARAQYWPTVTTSPSFQRSRASGNLSNTYTTTGGNGTTSNGQATNSGQQSTIWSFPIDISWVPDLWGKIRNEVRQAQYAAQVSAADLENERLTEQASLAEYYFEIRGQDALQQILDQTVDTDQKALDVTKGAYEAGVGDYISVVEAESTLEAAQSQAINVKVARAQYEHAIAVLVGKVASDFSIPAQPELTAPPPIPVGVPSELLQRRPDVAAAERTLAEANATIGIGYGAFFPSLTLSATGGIESSALKNWFSWPSRFWSIGPSISQTIFNGGLYRAELHQYTATYNADVAAYRQTALTAFEQVEDYLAAVRLYSQQVERQQAAVQHAQEFLKLEMGRYETGIDPYIDVTTAQTTLLGDQQTLATIQVEEMTSAVTLIEALGGGWDQTQLPTPSQLTQQPPSSDYKLQK